LNDNVSLLNSTLTEYIQNVTKTEKEKEEETKIENSKQILSNTTLLTVDSVRDTYGRTLLSLAAWKGYSDICHYLLTEWKRYATTNRVAARVLRAHPNARFTFNGAYGWTPLGIASFCGHCKTVEVLRYHGGNPYLGTEYFEDAFALSHVLFEWGGDPNNQYRKVMKISKQNDLLIPTVNPILQGVLQLYIDARNVSTKNVYLCDRAPITYESVQAALALAAGGGEDGESEKSLSLFDSSGGRTSKKREELERAKKTDRGLYTDEGQLLNVNRKFAK
jgi:hypothetical protein